jgi:phosphate transport system protein
MPGKHILESFDQDLELLREEVQRLAEQAEEQLERALEALLNDDRLLAQEVVASDVTADRLQQQINLHMNIVLACQQAMADDLREILAAGRIAAHLERLADYAKNTAKRTQVLSRKVDAEVGAQFSWMSERVGAMLRQVMRAYQERDAAEANVAWSSDIELDRMYGKLFAHLLEQMQQDPGSIRDATQLLFIAKGLERAGDHVTDIAEEIYLMVTGAPLQGPRPKVDNIAPE